MQEAISGHETHAAGTCPVGIITAKFGRMWAAWELLTQKGGLIGQGAAICCGDKGSGAVGAEGQVAWLVCQEMWTDEGVALKGFEQEIRQRPQVSNDGNGLPAKVDPEPDLQRVGTVEEHH